MTALIQGTVAGILVLLLVVLVLVAFGKIRFSPRVNAHEDATHGAQNGAERTIRSRGMLHFRQTLLIAVLPVIAGVLNAWASVHGSTHFEISGLPGSTTSSSTTTVTITRTTTQTEGSIGPGGTGPKTVGLRSALIHGNDLTLSNTSDLSPAEPIGQVPCGVVPGLQPVEEEKSGLSGAGGDYYNDLAGFGAGKGPEVFNALSMAVGSCTISDVSFPSPPRLGDATARVEFRIDELNYDVLYFRVGDVVGYVMDRWAGAGGDSGLQEELAALCIGRLRGLSGG